MAHMVPEHILGMNLPLLAQLALSHMCSVSKPNQPAKLGTELYTGDAAVVDNNGVICGLMRGMRLPCCV